MAPVKLERLVAAIAKNEDVDWSGDPLLAVSSSPIPYIPPKFNIKTTTASGKTTAEKLAVEVVFVQAPAAVGKSVTAKYLSSCRNAPVLDLATAGIGGASLDGLIGRSALYNDRTDPTQALKNFHAGKHPIIVDALDEGQMVTGPTAFEAFLEYTARLILDNRVVKYKPKIIFFGRPEATDLSDAAIQISGNSDIETCVVELDFFTKDEAVDLIKSYTKLAIEEAGKNIFDADKRVANERRIDIISKPAWSPLDNLIDWYFNRIEAALQIPENKLWEHDIGKAFAGYAPVLSAIGRLLAEIETPNAAINELKEDGEGTAWAVIERVMQYILERERHKVIGPLSAEYGNTLDQKILAEAYDSYEQLNCLVQLLQGKQASTVAGRSRFPVPRHNQTYINNVRNFCAEHPFIVRKDEGASTAIVAANDVFESYILTNAIHSQLLEIEYAHLRLEHLSRNPFLWRCFWHHQLTHSGNATLLDGQYVGFLLRSYCSDPLTEKESQIFIHDSQGKIMVAGIGKDKNSVFQFEASPPLKLFGSIRNCDIDLTEFDVEIVGDAKKGRGGDATTFLFLGDNSISCRAMKVAAGTIAVSGSLLVETDRESESIPGLKLLADKGRIGVGGAICNSAPWSDWSIEQGVHTELPAPDVAKPAFNLIQTIEIKFGKNPFFIYVNDNNRLDEDDNTIRWFRRCEGYQAFLNISIGSGVASRVARDARGSFNRRIEFKVTMEELRDAGSHLLSENGSKHATGISREIREFWRRYGITQAPAKRPS